VSHSMRWSARNNSDCGMVTPTALAVLRLITNSNLVGCSMAGSAGLAPLKIYQARPETCRGDFRRRRNRPACTQPFLKCRARNRFTSSSACAAATGWPPMEGLDIEAREIVDPTTEVEGHAPSLGRHRQTAADRKAIVAVPVPDARRLIIRLVKALVVDPHDGHAPGLTRAVAKELGIAPVWGRAP
jgi:hypothetical protein